MPALRPASQMRRSTALTTWRRELQDFAVDAMQ
jgi:hypothetical protein